MSVGDGVGVDVGTSDGAGVGTVDGPGIGRGDGMVESVGGHVSGVGRDDTVGMDDGDIVTNNVVDASTLPERGVVHMSETRMTDCGRK